MTRQLLLYYASACSIYLFAFCSPVFAASIETPESLPGGTIISILDAKKLLGTADTTFIDTRNPVNYGRGHVPGAILVQYKMKSRKIPKFNPKLDQFDLSRLPQNKQTKVIFYSHGSTGWKSYKAATLAIRNGYKNVYWMRQGLNGWKSNGFPVQ